MKRIHQHLVVGIALCVTALVPIATRLAYEAADTLQQRALASITERHGHRVDAVAAQWATEHRWPTDAEFDHLRAVASRIDADPRLLERTHGTTARAGARPPGVATERGLLNMSAVLEDANRAHSRDALLEARADFVVYTLTWPFTILLSLAAVLIALMELNQYTTLRTQWILGRDL